LAQKAKYKVIAKIDSIIGSCPVYKGGEKIVVENSAINLDETDAVCLPLLSTMMHEFMWRQHLGHGSAGAGGWDYSKERTKCPKAAPPYGEGYVVVSWETVPLEK